MNSYFFIKWLHIVGAGFYVSFSYGSYAIYYCNKNKILLLKNLSFVGLPCLIVQLLTGFAVIAAKPYANTHSWIWATLLGYLLLTVTFLGALIAVKTDAKLRLKTFMLANILILMLMMFFMANTPG